MEVPELPGSTSLRTHLGQGVSHDDHERATMIGPCQCHVNVNGAIATSESMTYMYLERDSKGYPDKSMVLA